MNREQLRKSARGFLQREAEWVALGGNVQPSEIGLLAQAFLETDEALVMAHAALNVAGRELDRLEFPDEPECAAINAIDTALTIINPIVGRKSK
jgi:hypothetical protein